MGAGRISTPALILQKLSAGLSILKMVKKLSKIFEIGIAYHRRMQKIVPLST
jgi:hypothetical protein